MGWFRAGFCEEIKTVLQPSKKQITQTTYNPLLTESVFEIVMGWF